MATFSQILSCYTQHIFPSYAFDHVIQKLKIFHCFSVKLLNKTFKALHGPYEINLNPQIYISLLTAL